MNTLKLSNILVTGGVRQLLAANYDKDLSQKLLSQTFGNFRPFKVIHQSQLSCVLLAERTDQAFEQKVIIKVLSTPESKDQPTKFNQEWQILAQLNHHGIAQIYDASITKNNHHYMIMEHVNGLQIDRYCDEHNLSIKSRLKIFIQVLDAVKFAHENLVLHKDIKPANILVQADGQVKLLDFGISGWVNETVSSDQLKVFTPAFASPEQINSEPMNIKSDIYQLGLLLYQLLVGTQPFINPSLKLEQLLSLIEHPHRISPSAYLRTLAQAKIDDLIKQRNTSHRKLNKLLEDELDLIVLKCIQADPNQRYRHVDLLKQDLENILINKPISLKAQNYFYKTKKSLIRNSAIYLLVFTILLTVITFTTIYIKDLTYQEELTYKEKEKADGVANYLVNLLQNTDTQLDLPNKPSLNQLVLAASEQLNQATTMDYEVHRELVMILSSSLTRMQNYNEALELLNSVIPQDFKFNFEGSDDFKFYLLLGRAYYDTGDFSRAVHIYEAMLNSDVYPQVVPQEQASLHKYMSEVNRKLKNFEAAETQVKYALEIQHTQLLKNNLSESDNQYSELIQSQNLLAGIYINQKKFIAARQVFAEAINLLKSSNRHDTVEYITIVGNYAILNDMTDEPQVAEQLLTETIGLLGAKFPQRHSLRASHINTLANVKHNTERTEEAVGLVKQSIDIYIEHYGASYHKLLSPYQNAVNYLIDLQRCDEAENYHQKMLVLRRSMALDNTIDKFNCSDKVNSEQMQ